MVTFGFKYGIPVDADMVVDMRFLPNPHWVPELATRPGRDADVRDYVMDQPDAQVFLDRYVPLLETVDAGFLRERKQFMTSRSGCTGGKHRSVAMAEEIARRLRDARRGRRGAVHRDLGRE